MRLLPPLGRAFAFDPPRVLMAQLALLRKGFGLAVRASAFVVCVTAVVYQERTGDARIWWWAGVALLMGLLSVVARARMPNPEAMNFCPRRHARAMCLMVAVHGGVWGVGALCFIRPGQPDVANLFVCMIAGLSSAALALFGPCWPVALSYWFSSVVPLVVALLRLEDAVSVAIGLGSVAYIWAMLLYSHQAARLARDAIDVRFENEDLVKRLREQSQDATDARRQAESALVEAKEANRAKTVFLASASHDLRQPLHAAGLYLGALARAGVNERQQRLLEHVKASNDAANEMLNTLLDFSKVDAGVVRPQPRCFALQPMCHKLAREMAPMAEGKGLAFRLRDTQLTVHADPTLVEMVLRNLLVNAVRYTDQGAVLLGCRLRGEHVVVEVWDTGVGIPEHQHRDIFREFHQLGNPERDRRKGLGLGLAIVDGLAKAMGATVSLSSRPGRGSVFRLMLPLSHQAVASEVAVSAQADLCGLQVLLIEDDVAVLAAMADLLTAWGCRCETACTIDEALARLSVFTPHMLVADYRLRDDRTGVQAIAAVREAVRASGQWSGGATDDLAALIVTGDTAPERLREAHASGLQLLHKPVPAEQLHAALLSQWRQIQQTGQGGPASTTG